MAFRPAWDSGQENHPTSSLINLFAKRFFENKKVERFVHFP